MAQKLLAKYSNRPLGLGVEEWMNLVCCKTYAPWRAASLDRSSGPHMWSRPDATSATRRTTTSVFWSQLDPRGGAGPAERHTPHH